MTSRPRAYEVAYWAPCPGLLPPTLRIVWRYRHHYLYLPKSPFWPALTWGDW